MLLTACTTVVHGTYPNDRVMWDDIAAHAEPITLTTTVAAVAPHHLIDAPELAGFWAALARPA